MHPTRKSNRTGRIARMLMRAVLLAAFSALPSPAPAEVVPDLHVAQRPVADTGDPERTRATVEALADVIVKLTGDSRLPSSEAALPLTARAGDFVARYAYEAAPSGTAPNDANPPSGQRLLRVWFDPARLEAALTARGVALWPADRPAVRLD